MAEIIYQLKQYAGAPHQSHIMWLAENDMDKFNEHLVLVGQKPGKDDWLKEMYEAGVARYCLLYHDGLPVARGAVEPLTDEVWEAADMRTAKVYHGKGFAKEMLRFLSQYIIEHGKIASCRTEEDNVAMQKVIKSVGYKEMAQ
ncbi:MAG: GNAT family N-acetyltransferase [Defluviitaleaceae bacterium]|nr:GNAT family N-acetyltransferase [Defluviitaleaceae bacterium]